jgi:hypothetical protein
MTGHRADHRSWTRWRLPAACSAATALACGLICMTSGPFRLAAALLLLGAFIGSIWILHRARFAALGPSVGLALAGLTLIGLAFAAAGALTIVPIASAIAAVTLAAAWARTLYPGTAAERGTQVKRPGPFAVGGVIIFAVLAAFSVRYSAVSATADSDHASSPALWAYPVGDQFDVGVRQPAGQPPTSLRIVVTQAGSTLAAWQDIRLAPGQAWRAQLIALSIDGPVQVVAFQGKTIVARLSG